MVRKLVIASGAGGGDFLDDAAVIGAVELLRRRAAVEVHVVSRHPEATARCHPELRVIGVEALPESLVDCELVCAVGVFADAPAIEAVALQVAAARLQGIATALVAARVTSSAHPLSRSYVDDILARSESVSAADAASAARFAGVRRRRVEVACPLELLVPPVAWRPEPGTLSIDARFYDRVPAELRARLVAALVATGCRRGLLLGAREAPGPGAELDLQPCTAWPDVRAALARSAFVVGGADAGVHALAFAAGIPSVALVTTGEVSSLHARLGLTDLVLPLGSPMSELGPLFARAVQSRDRAFAHRTAPLRSLAHRALAALAESGRAQAFDPATGSTASRRLVARAAALLAEPALVRGDAPRALAVLDPWRTALATETDWALAHARASALLGCDTEACKGLETALAAHPEDRACLAALGRARARRGDSDGAASVWRTLARLDPLAAEPHAELGQLDFVAGRHVSALDHWLEALRRDPLHVCARSAAAYLETDPRAATRFWAALTVARADVGPFWYQLGVATEASGDLQTAEAHFRRAADLDPDDARCLEALGRAVARRDAVEAQPILARARALGVHPAAVAGTPAAGV